jgi:hypothetical protein
MGFFTGDSSVLLVQKGKIMIPQNNIMQTLQQFQQFKNNFKGNPQEQVQQLLNSGRVTQADYDRAVQMASQLQSMLGINS